jgi:ribosome-associated protein
MIEFKLDDEFIELYKLIKLLDLVDSGADAKLLIANAHVMRNGEVELKKRAKIRQGEVIQIAEVTIKVL